MEQAVVVSFQLSCSSLTLYATPWPWQQRYYIAEFAIVSSAAAPNNLMNVV
jgi:hypothetical protein